MRSSGCETSDLSPLGSGDTTTGENIPRIEYGAVYRGSAPASLCLHGSNTNFIQVPHEVGGIVINTVGAGAFELILAIAARKQTHAQRRSGSAGGQHVPNAVAHDDGIL